MFGWPQVSRNWGGSMKPMQRQPRSCGSIQSSRLTVPRGDRLSSNASRMRNICSTACARRAYLRNNKPVVQLQKFWPGTSASQHSSVPEGPLRSDSVQRTFRRVRRPSDSRRSAAAARMLGLCPLRPCNFRLPDSPTKRGAVAGPRRGRPAGCSRQSGTDPGLRQSHRSARQDRPDRC